MNSKVDIDVDTKTSKGHSDFLNWFKITSETLDKVENIFFENSFIFEARSLLMQPDTGTGFLLDNEIKP